MTKTKYAYPKLRLQAQFFLQFLALTLFFVTGYLPQVCAVTVEEIEEAQELSSPSQAAYDQYGTSAAIFGDILAVSAPRHDSFWEDSGAVYIYQKIDGRWEYIQKIQANMPREGGLFGYALSLNGFRLYVGEPGSEERQEGLVHIFIRNGHSSGTWTWLKSISRPGDCHLNINDGFGSSLSVANDRLLVGSPHACRSRERWFETTGAAYLYSNYGDLFLSKLSSPNSDVLDTFGAAVSLCGKFAFIGAPGSDNGISRSDSGAAYIFSEEINWGLCEYINPYDTFEGDRFGSSVSCFGDYAAISAPGATKNYGKDDRKGFVNIYKKSEGGSLKWSTLKKLREESFYNVDQDKNHLFGQSLQLHSGFLIVGYGESMRDGAAQEPAGHIFKLVNGTCEVKRDIFFNVEPSCETSGLDMGYAVATDGNVFFIGDMEDETDLQLCEQKYGRASIFNRDTKDVVSLPSIHFLLGN